MTSYNIVELKKINSACPSDWEGKLDNGHHIYIRFRWGHLTARIGDTEDNMWSSPNYIYDEQISDDLDGIMSTRQMFKHTKNILNNKTPQQSLRSWLDDEYPILITNKLWKVVWRVLYCTRGHHKMLWAGQTEKGNWGTAYWECTIPLCRKKHYASDISEKAAQSLSKLSVEEIDNDL